jgi:hypothetical protein
MTDARGRRKRAAATVARNSASGNDSGDSAVFLRPQANRHDEHQVDAESLQNRSRST